MAEFLVQWTIDIEAAETPEDAARQAWAHMRRPDSTANFFMVWPKGRDEEEGTSVDLSELEQEPHPLHTAEGLRGLYGNWGEHPAYPSWEWRADETRLSYWDWVASKLEQAQDGEG